jgi:hypothetical protein
MSETGGYRDLPLGEGRQGVKTGYKFSRKILLQMERSFTRLRPQVSIKYKAFEALSQVKINTQDTHWNGSNHRDGTENDLNDIWRQSRSGSREEGIAIVI